LDVNTPRMYVSVLEERIRKLEKEGKIEKVEYTWRVGGKDIKISLNGYKSEIGYISLRKKLRLEEISLLRE